MDLASRGLAVRYYYITNMTVDAPIAAQMASAIEQMGVKEAHICGREWLTLNIRTSNRLRALVPRVYGLGDLSLILDSRRAEQTQALLGHLMPSLRTYVPTAAHRQAVRVLGEYGIVLLVGAPATGKSMIATILAAHALGGEGHSTYQFDGPGEFTQYWNPNETGRFYWIDDAFGPNQLRADYVDHWIAIMSKVKAAIHAGNRFVLTSRQHIWREAKLKLSTRNHPKFEDESAVVNVGVLSPDERTQILYNHIKGGNQASSWKKSVKAHLPKIAESPGLLPELARRLGDRQYTAGIRSLPGDLIRFVAEPKEFLKGTLRELTDPQRAALTAVFLFRSRLPLHIGKDERLSLISDRFGVTHGEINEALIQLEGSFLLLKTVANERMWTFAHPTITDALADILRDRSDLLELYLQGARLDVILDEVVCEGAPAVRDAIVVPETFNELLVRRLSEAPDVSSVNGKLLSFLADRVSDSLLRQVIAQHPQVIRRRGESFWRAGRDDRLKLHGKLHAIGLLPSDLREEASHDLEAAILSRHDASALRDEQLMALLTPSQTLVLSAKIYELLVNGFPDTIENIESDPNLDIDPTDNFSDIEDYLRDVEVVFGEVKMVSDQISDLSALIDSSKDSVREKWEEANREIAWSGSSVVPSAIKGSAGGRSVFSDVDD